MKKLLTAVLCVIVVFSMTFTAFGAQNSRYSDYCGNSDGTSISLSDVGDALSGFLSDLADAVPEVVASLEEALPEIVSGMKDTIDEKAENAKDALDAILEQLGIASDESDADMNIQDAVDESTKESLQELASVIGGFVASGVDDPSADDTTDDVADDVADVEDENGGETMLVGGWTVNTQFVSQLSEEEEEIFTKAETTLAGGAYQPVAVIATQLVAGMNYAYLCLGAPDDEGQNAGWYIVTLYQDLQGNVTTMSIRQIDLGAIKTIGNIYNPSFVGAWTANIPEDEDGAPVLPDDAQAAFEEATAEYVGVGYTPIALFGTQVVAGLNYKILCYGTLVTREPVTSWYVMDIYQDLQGNCSITDVQLLDLTGYISYGEEEAADQ